LHYGSSEGNNTSIYFKQKETIHQYIYLSYIERLLACAQQPCEESALQVMPTSKFIHAKKINLNHIRFPGLNLSNNHFQVLLLLY